MPRLIPAAVLLGLVPAAAVAADPAPAPAPTTLPGTTVPAQPLAGPLPAMATPWPVYPTVAPAAACDPCGPRVGVMGRLKWLVCGTPEECMACGPTVCTTPKPAVVKEKVKAHAAPAKEAACPTCGHAGRGGNFDRLKAWFCWQPAYTGFPRCEPTPYHAPLLAYFRECREPQSCGGGCGPAGCGPNGCAVAGADAAKPASGGAVAKKGKAKEKPAEPAVTATEAVVDPAAPAVVNRSPYGRIVGGPLAPGLRFAAPEAAPRPVVVPPAEAAKPTPIVPVSRPFTNP